MSERPIPVFLDEYQTAYDRLREYADAVLHDENAVSLSTEYVLSYLSQGLKAILELQRQRTDSPTNSALVTHKKMGDLYEFASICEYPRNPELAAKFTEGMIRHRFECVNLQLKIAENK